MTKWIEYTGSDEQIEELVSAKTLVRVRYPYGREVNWSYTLFKSESNARDILQDAIAYLISEPHPYADLIKIWADTGCPVWVKGDIKVMSHLLHTGNKVTPYPTYTVIKTTKPDWNIPGAEYRLTPFED